MRTRATLLAVLLCLLPIAIAHAQTLAVAKPEQVGLAPERLARITATLKRDVDGGVIPGAVLLVARHGKVALFETLTAGCSRTWSTRRSPGRRGNRRQRGGSL